MWKTSYRNLKCEISGKMPKAWVLHHRQDPVSEHHSVVMWLQHRTGSCFESRSWGLMTFFMIMGSYLKSNLKISHLFLTNKIKDDSIKTNTWDTSHLRHAHLKLKSEGNSDAVLPLSLHLLAVSIKQLICHKCEVLIWAQQRTVLLQS